MYIYKIQFEGYNHCHVYTICRKLIITERSSTKGNVFIHYPSNAKSEKQSKKYITKNQLKP